MGAAVVDGDWTSQTLDDLEEQLVNASDLSKAIRLVALLKQEVSLGAQDVRTGKVKLVGAMTVPSRH